MELENWALYQNWSTGHNTLLETTASMTSWTARGHGDAPAKHSHLVPGHRPSSWWQQCMWLSGPACWTPLGNINRQGSPWKILRQWTSAKVQQVPEAVFILALVVILKIAAVTLCFQWLWNVCDLPPPPDQAGAHVENRTRDGHVLPVLLAGGYGPKVSSLTQE